jgi:hypothetical protein
MHLLGWQAQVFDDCRICSPIHREHLVTRPVRLLRLVEGCISSSSWHVWRTAVDLRETAFCGRFILKGSVAPALAQALVGQLLCLSRSCI